MHGENILAADVGKNNSVAPSGRTHLEQQATKFEKTADGEKIIIKCDKWKRQ